jgi:hypothetical protein
MPWRDESTGVLAQDICEAQAWGEAGESLGEQVHNSSGGVFRK